MFNWFIKKYGITMAEEREENRQQMATNWQPTNSFEQLVTRLFLNALYASAARYPMEERDIIDISLRMIKPCGMYAKEYKAWIGIKNAGQLALPHVKQTLNSFKGLWSNAITLVNQPSIPALQHGYGMVAMDNNGSSIASYGESLANFGAAYAATQETVKSQADSLSAIQAQLAGLQQFCMAVKQQQPPPNNIYYAHQQQQQQQRPPVSYYPMQNLCQQPPAQFGQRFTMAVPPPQQGTTMMNYVGQFPLSARPPSSKCPSSSSLTSFLSLLSSSLDNSDG
jgi:hypothetical protein